MSEMGRRGKGGPPVQGSVDDCKMDMKDMSMASSRIYIGNLNDSVDSDKLYVHFAGYGKILGIKRPAKKSYAFVQFDSDESAQEAIKNENQKGYHGRTLIVRAAIAGRNKDSMQTDNDAGSTGDNRAGSQTHSQGDSASDRTERAVGGGGGGGRGGGGGNSRNFRGDRYPPPRSRPDFRNRSPQLQNDNDWQDRGGYDDRYNSNDAFEVPERNDCEIIVVSKQLTEYAEYVEQQLKCIGLTVDLLFPNEDVPIGRVLGNILSRGSLYAILVMPQNEERRSITLNILHGLPQEHRNMPLDDALDLISRNFSELQKFGSTPGHEKIVGLLKQVINGRSLTVLQYDRCLQYMRDCRDKRVKVEFGETALHNPADKTQVDLKERIMSILNNDKLDASAQRTIPPLIPNLMSSDSDNDRSKNELRERISSMLGATVSQGQAPQPVAAPGMKTAITNPTIQKALDSLLNKMN